MGNFTLSEIIWIMLVILIVFGPHRLPELARKAGALAAKARQAAQTVRDELTTEYGDTIAPLRDVGDELKAARRELRDSASSILREVDQPSRPPSPRPRSPKPRPAAPVDDEALVEPAASPGSDNAAPAPPSPDDAGEPDEAEGPA